MQSSSPNSGLVSHDSDDEVLLLLGRVLSRLASTPTPFARSQRATQAGGCG